MDIHQFLVEIVQANPDTDQDLVRKAYEWAERGHAGDTRKGGGAYFEHPVAVALLLKGNSDRLICAALLHDLVEDTEVTLDEVTETFGAEIAFLVDGVTKYPKPKNRDYDREVYREKNREKIRHYTKQDKRVILIKLADRQHNLATLHMFRKEKQQRIAKETLDFYVPMAKKYGFEQFRAELKELAEQFV